MKLRCLSELMRCLLIGSIDSFLMLLKQGCEYQLNEDFSSSEGIERIVEVLVASTEPSSSSSFTEHCAIV